MKTFLFATDFSENACNALEFAVPFIKELKGQLVLFHAFPSANPYVEMPPYEMVKIEEASKQEAIDQLVLWQKLVHEIDPELSCEYIARSGSFVNTLIAVSEEADISGIFMGTKGASGIKKALIGSNTAKVIEKVSCPVWAIPEGSTYNGINAIVYATDFQEENRIVLQKVNELADTFDARIEILHVATENAKVDLIVYDWYQKAVKELFPRRKVSFRVVQQQRVQHGISNYVKEEQPDLVIMAMHKKNWVDRLLSGSYTKQQAFHTQKPLLIYHIVNEGKDNEKFHEKSDSNLIGEMGDIIL